MSRLLIASVVGVMSLSALGTIPAHAESLPPDTVSPSEDSAPRAMGIPCGRAVTTIRNVRNAPALKEKIPAPYGYVTAVGPGDLTLSHSVTVGNSVSGTAGIDYGKINASVGFDVTKAWTVQTSYANHPPAGRRWGVQAYRVYNVKKFDWSYMSGCAGSMKTTSGHGTAKQFDHLEYVTLQNVK